MINPIVRNALDSLRELGKLGRSVGMSKSNEIYSCPFHAHGRTQRTPSFGVNIETGAWNCFNPSCDGRGRSVYSLYSRLTRVPVWEAQATLGTFVASTDMLQERLREIPTSPQKTSYSGMRLQEPWPDCIEISASKEATAYMEHRHISREMWEKVGAKYFPGAFLPRVDPLAGRVEGRRIMLPIYYWGKALVGYSARSINSDSGLKYFRPVENVGNFFYNPLMISPEISDFIVLVEGEFDALACLREGIPAYGCFRGDLTEAQIEEASRYETVYLAFDNDKAGIAGMTKAEEDFSGRTHLRYIRIPKKDPGELEPGFGKEFFSWASDEKPVLIKNNHDLVSLLS